MNDTQIDSSKTCPACGSKAVKKIKSAKLISTSGDRLCGDCNARWAPPVSRNTALAMGVLCTLLAAFAFVAITRIEEPSMWLIPCLGGTGFAIAAVAAFGIAAKGGIPLEIHETTRKQA